jgi:hypothetical protein
MLYEMTAPQFVKTLKNLTAILDKATTYAETKKFDTAVLMQSRLAPDQLPFGRQIQIACDTAKLGCSRVTTKPAPENADTEATFAEIKTRIESTIKFLETINAKDFVGAEERRVTTPRWEGKTLSGTEYIVHHTIPNFYFHVTTAYSILRHNGVEIGKSDYLGPIPFKA